MRNKQTPRSTTGERGEEGRPEGGGIVRESAPERSSPRASEASLAASSSGDEGIITDREWPHPKSGSSSKLESEPVYTYISSLWRTVYIQCKYTMAHRVYAYKYSMAHHELSTQSKQSELHMTSNQQCKVGFWQANTPTKLHAKHYGQPPG